MAEALATKYRPRTLEEMVSQNSIVKILNKQLETGQIHNTYLFCGASGCGKTTAGRAFAAKLNDVPYGKDMPGVIEIDAASNNGVDNVREITKSAMERSIQSKYKVYIIDECHALSSSSWQAFLKVLEEPPAHTIFIFCTTDPQKIPATILNRVMRFNFTRIPSDLICDRLNYICEAEGFTNYKQTCDYISRICGGGMRDGISLLEKCASYSTDLSLETALEALGNFSYDVFFNLVNYLIDGNEAKVIETIQNTYNSGKDLKLFVNQFLDFCLDVSKYILCQTMKVTKLPISFEERVKDSINFDNAAKYYDYITTSVLNISKEIKDGENLLSLVTILFLRIARCQ